MASECWLGLLMGSDDSSTLWEGSWMSPTVVVGVLAPNNSGRKTEAGNIEYICMQSLINPLHSLSLFSSPSVFYSILYIIISNQLAYMQACMVCMYACVHIGVHCWQDGVSLRGSNTDGHPFVWVCRMETPCMGLSRDKLLPNSDQGDLSQVSHLSGCTHVCMYACTYMGAFACVCVGGTG